MQQPRELDDVEGYNAMILAIGALLAATPTHAFVVDRSDFRPGSKVLLEILESGGLRFSLATGRAQ